MWKGEASRDMKLGVEACGNQKQEWYGSTWHQSGTKWYHARASRSEVYRVSLIQGSKSLIQRRWWQVHAIMTAICTEYCLFHHWMQIWGLSIGLTARRLVEHWSIVCFVTHWRRMSNTVNSNEARLKLSQNQRPKGGGTPGPWLGAWEWV